MLAHPLAADAPQPVRFTLTADASAGLLPRLLEPFARRDLIPDRVTAQCSGAALLVEIAMDAMPAEMLHLVECNLRQVVGLRALTREIAGSLPIAA